MTRKVLLLGCGYIGQPIALKEIAAGACVYAIVKSNQSAEKLSKNGIVTTVLNFDEKVTQTDALLASYDVIYYLLPPQPTGYSDLRIQRFFSVIRDGFVTSKFVLISTTGVYGDCSGEWVDEGRAPQPAVARARRRLSAEQQCREWCMQVGVSLVILRVGGIYGVGKLPLQRLKRGDPVLRQELSPWSNRIYAMDLIEACFRAARFDVTGVLNAVDGNPSTMTEYFFQVADFAGLRRPVQITMEQAVTQLGSGILSYLSESRRIGNNRLIEELGADCIRFPTLDQGLADIRLKSG